MSTFRDKIAFVTGGGSGLGRALCEELASCGAVCIVTDINESSAGRVADAISAAGGRALAMKLDVSEGTSVTEAVDRAVAKYGRLDYMFSNAAVKIWGEFRDMCPEHWDRTIGVNLLGVIHGATAAYDHMIRQGHGHIVNIASLAGLTQLPTCTAYAMTKHAVVGLTTSLRPEASRFGVKVSVVCPGVIDTGGEVVVVQGDRKTTHFPTAGKELLTPTAAARLILEGVKRNKAVIVFPFTARLQWRLHRIHPALLTPLHSRIIDALGLGRAGGKQNHAESAR